MPEGQKSQQLAWDDLLSSRVHTLTPDVSGSLEENPEAGVSTGTELEDSIAG